MPAANRFLFTAAVVVPLALLPLAGWVNFREVQSEASERAAQAAEALGEHALRTLRTHELIIDFVDHSVQGQTWGEMRASADLHRLLKHLTDRNDEVASVFLLGPDGNSWVSSRRFPMPGIDGSDRDYYQALRAEDRLYISQPALGRLFDDRFFAVARRRSSASGEFDGLIAVSVNPSYFESFYAALLKPTQAASLVRADGVVLARNPAMQNTVSVLPPGSGFMQAIAAQPRAGLLPRGPSSTGSTASSPTSASATIRCTRASSSR